MDEDIEILINEIDEFKKQLHFILTQTVAPALKEMIITVAKKVSRPLNKALKTYLSNTDLILNKTHIDLDFIKDCRYLAVGINDHCDVSTAPPIVEKKTLKDRLHNVKAKTIKFWNCKPIKWIRQFTYDCSTQIISNALFSLLIYLLRVWGVL